jgi:hypothetical protein
MNRSDREVEVREFVEIATDDELVKRIMGLDEKIQRQKDQIADLQSIQDGALSAAEKAISYGSAAFTPQTAPIFALAIRNEIFRSLRSTVRKHGTIGQDRFPRVASNLAFRVFRLLALFHIEIDEKLYEHYTGKSETNLKD